MPCWCPCAAAGAHRTGCMVKPPAATPPPAPTAFTQSTCGNDHALIPSGLCGFGGMCWAVEKARLVVLEMSVARLWEPG